LEDKILNKIRGLLLPVTGKKILVGGVLLVLLIVAVGAMASPSSSGGATSTVTPIPDSTVAPTAEATATKATPTATPTLSSYMGILVEHPASATTEDMTSKINTNNGQEYKIIDSFHRATIDGRDVYIGTMELDNGAHAKLYIFPLGSYDEARAALSAYVNQFLSKGFTKVGDDTSNSAQDSYITLQNSQQVGVQALGFNTATEGAALTINISQ
jgi:hypothetical protein